MKKLLFIFSILSAFHTVTKAQNIEVGTGIQFINFRGADVSNPIFYPVVENRFIFTALFSGFIPVHSNDDDLVIGFNPNLSMGALSSTVSMDLPLLLTARYGAGSSEYSTRIFGFGIGAGALLSYINTWINNMRPIPYSFAYYTPIIMGEVTIVPVTGRLMRLRCEYTPLALFRSDATFQGEISQLNVRLVRDF